MTKRLVYSFSPTQADNCHARGAGYSKSVLSLVMRYGPLLMPEVVSVPGVRGSWAAAEPFDILQQRFCLTMIEPDELLQHMRRFGPVSLVFRPEAMIRAGAVPVSYFPKYAMGHGANTVGLEIIHHVRQAAILVGDLQKVKSADPRAYARQMNLTLARATAFRSDFNDLLDSIGADDETLTLLRGALNTLSQFFYPVEQDIAVQDASFDYFQEREWRVLGGIILGDGQTTSAPADAELTRCLLAIDPDLFSLPIIFDGRRRPLIDLIARLSPGLWQSTRGGLVEVVCTECLADELAEWTPRVVPCDHGDACRTSSGIDAPRARP